MPNLRKSINAPARYDEDADVIDTRRLRSSRPAYPQLMAQGVVQFDPDAPPAVFPSLPLTRLITPDQMPSDSPAPDSFQEDCMKVVSFDNLNQSDQGLRVHWHEQNEKIDMRSHYQTLDSEEGSLSRFDRIMLSSPESDTSLVLGWKDLALAMKLEIFSNIRKNDRAINKLGLNEEDFRVAQEHLLTESEISQVYRSTITHPVDSIDLHKKINEEFEEGITAYTTPPSHSDFMNRRMDDLVRAARLYNPSAYEIDRAREFLRQKGVGTLFAGAWDIDSEVPGTLPDQDHKAWNKKGALQHPEVKFTPRQNANRSTRFSSESWAHTLETGKHFGGVSGLGGGDRIDQTTSHDADGDYTNKESTQVHPDSSGEQDKPALQPTSRQPQEPVKILLKIKSNGKAVLRKQSSGPRRRKASTELSWEAEDSITPSSTRGKHITESLIPTLSGTPLLSPAKRRQLSHRDDPEKVVGDGLDAELTKVASNRSLIARTNSTTDAPHNSTRATRATKVETPSEETEPPPGARPISEEDRVLVAKYSGVPPTLGKDKLSLSLETEQTVLAKRPDVQTRKAFSGAAPLMLESSWNPSKPNMEATTTNSVRQKASRDTAALPDSTSHRISGGSPRLILPTMESNGIEAYSDEHLLLGRLRKDLQEDSTHTAPSAFPSPNLLSISSHEALIRPTNRDPLETQGAPTVLLMSPKSPRISICSGLSMNATSADAQALPATFQYDLKRCQAARAAVGGVDLAQNASIFSGPRLGRRNGNNEVALTLDKDTSDFECARKTIPKTMTTPKEQRPQGSGIKGRPTVVASSSEDAPVLPQESPKQSKSKARPKAVPNATPGDTGRPKTQYASKLREKLCSTTSLEVDAAETPLRSPARGVKKTRKDMGKRRGPYNTKRRREAERLAEQAAEAVKEGKEKSDSNKEN